MTRTLQNTTEYEMGQIEQTNWLRKLTERGFLVVPTYGMVGVAGYTDAPMLFSCPRDVVAPDFLVFPKNHPPAWHDTKGKELPSWFRNLRRWEHGIDWAVANDYKYVQDHTGVHVFVVVHENWAPQDPAADSQLLETDNWLSISIDDAFKYGDHRLLWPGGRNSGDYGRNGEGGLLWPRSIMQTDWTP